MTEPNMLILFPIVVLIGWGAGMLVNYLADILPIKRRITHPSCNGCDAPYDLINYLFWPKQCKNCGRRRNRRSWFVEFIFIIVSIILWANPPDRFGFPIALILLIYFSLVTIIDLEHRLIMHSVSLVGALMCLGVGIWLHSVRDTLLGGLAGFGVMLVLYFAGLGFLRLSSRRRKQDIEEEEALGFGDVNLCGVIGLLVGWPGIAGVLILGIIIAGLVSLIYLLVMVANRKYHPGLSLPYGPFLVAATILLLFYK